MHYSCDVLFKGLLFDTPKYYYENIFPLLMLFFLSVSIVSASTNPIPFYCGRMGYEYNDSDYRCYFGDDNSCDGLEFLEGECGSKYVKDLPCVPLGEPVFFYEECCEGERYLPQFSMGQPHCRYFTLGERIENQMRPYTWFLDPYIPYILLCLIAIVIVLVYFKKRK